MKAKHCPSCGAELPPDPVPEDTGTPGVEAPGVLGIELLKEVGFAPAQPAPTEDPAA